MNIRIDSIPSPPQDRAQDPLINAVLSGGNQPDICRIHRVADNNYVIYSEAKYLKFFVQSDLQTQKNSDLVVYANRNGALSHELVHCHLTEGKGLNDIGYAKNPGGKLSLLWWSDLDQDVPVSMQYRFSAVVCLPPQTMGNWPNTNALRRFIWKNKLRFMLVDEETDTVTAIVDGITAEAAQCWTLQILVPFGDDFALIALTSFLSICVKLKNGC
jgi:hypothetical protein